MTCICDSVYTQKTMWISLCACMCICVCVYLCMKSHGSRCDHISQTKPCKIGDYSNPQAKQSHSCKPELKFQTEKPEPQGPFHTKDSSVQLRSKSMFSPIAFPISRRMDKQGRIRLSYDLPESLVLWMQALSSQWEKNTKFLCFWVSSMTLSHNSKHASVRRQDVFHLF